MDSDLIKRVHNPLPGAQITSINGENELLLTAESIKDMRSPTPSGSANSHGLHNEIVEMLISLIGLLLDDDVKMGNANIDVHQGKRDEVIGLLRTLGTLEEKYRAGRQSVGRSPMQAGPSAA